MSDLGTTANVSAMSTLGTSANVTAMSNCSGSIANINTVSGSIADVNRYANEYTIASSAPSSPSEGDLWYDSTNNVLKYHTGSAFVSISSGIADVVADSTPQLGGNLDVVTHSIVSTANRNIAITPNGTGSVVIDGLSHPQADGSNGQVLQTNGSGTLSFTSMTSGGPSLGTNSVIRTNRCESYRN